MDKKQIDRVRNFNRIITQRIGALDDSYLSRGRPLGEARLIFEAGRRGGADLRELRQELNLDSGYLSRLLRSLEGQDIAVLRKGRQDGRVRELVLTAKGQQEFAAYEAASDGLAETFLAGLNPVQREKLVAAMTEIQRLLLIGSIEIRAEPADSDAARNCLKNYYAELGQRFDNGFDPDAVKNFDPAEMTPPKGYFVVAWMDGEAVGCGALKRLEAGMGEVKRVWTAPSARGCGVAGKIMDRLEDLAREAGMTTVRLDTNRNLSEAHALYRRLGYHEIERYNDNPYAHHWFEKRLADAAGA